MKQILSGTIVLPDRIIASGSITLENGIISAISEQVLPEAEQYGNCWILPGFIDVHLHGLGEGSPTGYESLAKMTAFAPSTGITRLCPTLGPAKFETITEYLRNIRNLVDDQPGGALIAGGHLEGPYMNPKRPGGMNIDLLRKPDTEEIKELLEIAGGTLKIVTLSPEVDGMDAAIKLFKNAGCAVSAGHTICPPEDLDKKVEAGISHVCHLFDTFDGRDVDNGVSVPCLADMILIDDRLTCEVIMDGLHVPPPLVKLARRAAGADRIIAITDAMQGAGLPDGEYKMSDGRIYTLKTGGLCRTKTSNIIVGSCLTMCQAFINMTKKFGFTASEASKALSSNPARLLGLKNETGKIAEGLAADITVLDPDGKVKKCFVKGETAYAS